MLTRIPSIVLNSLSLIRKAVAPALFLLAVITSACQSPGDEDPSLLSASEADSTGIGSQSDTELLIRFSQIMDQDKRRLSELRTDSSRLDPIFQERSQLLYRADERLDSLEAAETSPEQVALVKHERQQLKGLLNFLLERRRAIHQQIRILTRKIEKQQEAIDFVMKGEMTNVLEITEDQVLMADTLAAPATLPDSTLQNSNAVISITNPNQYNWEVVEASRELEISQARFEVAKKRWMLVGQLLALNGDDLSVKQTSVQSTVEQIDQWNIALASLGSYLRKLQAADSAPELQRTIQSRIDETTRTKEEIAGRLSTDSTVLRNLQTRVERLSAIQAPLSTSVAGAARKVEQQSRWLEYLQSPFAPHSILSFVVNNGPRIILTLLLLFLAWAGGRWLAVSILRSFNFRRYPSKEDREERVETLSRAIRSGITIVVLFAGILSILSEFGIDVSVLLGGAAVFSLAIAFGAQSLVKDYFSGFMILTENQYRVGNVIRVNQISGVVEDITLRTTTLRDLEGVAHFIPHGQINTVSNLTHQWSRVALNIGIAYKENVDRVMEVIMEVAQEMRSDPTYQMLITTEPEMLGVDAFADSAVVIKVLIQTKPLKQWMVKREFLRRLKNRFDELGIEIPFPHRTIYHRDIPEGENSPLPSHNNSMNRDV